MENRKIQIRDAIACACTDLKTAGIDSPALDAQLLLCAVLNTTRTALVASGDDTLAHNDLKLFNSLIERRKNGECTAYITGKKEFWGLEFLVNPSVLVPRPDTETLVETTIQKKKEVALAVRRKKNVKILDLCTGCGAIAAALKHEMPETEIWATDISAAALETAKANAERLLPAGSQIHFYEGDLFTALPASHFSSSTPNSPFAAPHTKFTIIVSNPPYIPRDKIKTLPIEVQNEPHFALDGGKSGLEIIERIISDAPNYLEQGGTILIEADPHQMIIIADLLETRGFSGIELIKDMSGLERVIGGIYEK